MNVTQETARHPRGILHLLRLNGPGTNIFRPEVIRRNIGVAYEVYKPMTAILYGSIVRNEDNKELLNYVSPR